ncbi:MAG: hypothetical protein WC624_00020 [Candidatus Margulisiibacteriota bacterium]
MPGNRSTQKKTAQPAQQPSPAEAPQNAELLEALQARLGITQIQAAQELSASEQCLKILCDLSDSDYLELKTACNLNSNDSINDLANKITQCKTHSPIIDKTKAALLRFGEYQEKEKEILQKLRVSRSAEFEHFETERNALLKRAFNVTLNLLKDDPRLARYYEILKKYNITSPLDITRDTLNKMSVLEETIFTSRTAQIKPLAISNLNHKELTRYFELEKSIKNRIDRMVTDEISANNKELAPIREKTLKIEGLLEIDSEIKDLQLSRLTKESASLIKEYISAYKSLIAALKTPQFDDDNIAGSALNKISESIIQEIGNEYKNAYIDTPTDPEKQSFKSLMLIIAKLHITDEKITSFFMRLANPVLSAEDRNDLFRARTLNFFGVNLSKTNINPLIYQNQSITSYIEANHKEFNHLLNNYAQSIRDYFKTIRENKSVIGSGHSRSTALFYALRSAGYSEQDLLVINAMTAYENIGSERKVLLTGTKEEQLKKCLEEIKKLLDFIKTDDFKKLSPGNKGKTLQDFDCLGMIIQCLAGSKVEGDYQINLFAFDTKFGATIESESSSYEETFNADDDANSRSMIKRFFVGGEGLSSGLNPWSILSNHIYNSRITNEPLDQGFIDEVTKHSPLGELAGYDGQYDLERLKTLFMECFINKALEINQQSMPNYEASRSKLLNWLKSFITAIRNEVKSNPKFAGSPEMEKRMGVLSLIHRALLESKLFTEGELNKYFSDNPIVPITAKLTSSDLNRGGVYRTVGYESLPSGIRDQFKNAGFADFCRQHPDLQIYWAPDDASNKAFGGYATFDDNTIVIVYQNKRQSTHPAWYLASVISHELQHKIDNRNLLRHISANPSYANVISITPSLITERNAYLTQLRYLSGLPQKTKAVKEYIKYISDIIIKSNILLDIKDLNNRTLIDPPYDASILQAQAIDIHPEINIPLNSSFLINLHDVISILGYDHDENNYLLGSCAQIISGGLLNLADTDRGNRNIIVDFIGKLMGANTNGYLTDELLNRIAAIKASADYRKKHTNDKSAAPIISSDFLLSLIIDFANRQRAAGTR